MRAVRWARGWELHIADVTGAAVGVTQVRRLSGAEAMVRDYVALHTGREPESFIVEISPEVPGGLSQEIAAIRVDSMRWPSAKPSWLPTSELWRDDSRRRASPALR